MAHDPSNPAEREASLHLLGQWYNSITGITQGHHDCQHKRSRTHMWLGIPGIILSGIGGSTLIASASGSVGPAVQWAAGTATLVGTILAALAAFLKFEDKAEKHRIAAVRGGALRRLIDQIRRAPPDDLRRAMDEVRIGWDTLQTEAPELPDDIFNKYRSMIVDGLPQ
jgi:hypothetical protein